MTIQTMLRNTSRRALAFALLLPLSATFSQSPQVNQGSKRVTVPKTWDDDAMSRLEVPLANPIGSPKQITADYYYRIPVRPIYKQYPVYTGTDAALARAQGGRYYGRYHHRHYVRPYVQRRYERW